MERHEQHDNAAGQGTPPGGPVRDARGSAQAEGFLEFLRGVPDDIAGCSPRRAWAVARLAISEAFRLRILGVLPLGLLAIVVADVTTRRLDPVFDMASSLVRIGEITITTVGLALSIFLSTYSLPHELSSKTIYSLVTKPVSRLEIVMGKMISVAAVLLLVTIGLGALSYAYFEVRGFQTAAWARERLAAMEAAPAEESPGGPAPASQLPTDAEPVALRRIAADGPFQAAVYRSPTQPLAIVNRRGRGKVEWLSGAANHLANWGFDRLPQAEMDSGRSRILVQVVLAESPEAPSPPEGREVLVQLWDEATRSEWASSFVLSPEGRLDITIPPKGTSPGITYGGDRFWVALCGADGAPLGVEADSCVIEAGGRRIRAASGLLMTKPVTMNRYWIEEDVPKRKLMGRARFDGVSPGRIGRRGSTLQVDVAVPSAANVPPGARAEVIVVNDDTGASRTVTFRPEKGSTVLVPLDQGFFPGGSLSAYVASAHPQVELGLSRESIRLRIGDRPFLLNWTKDLLMMWLGFCVLGSIGVMVSTVAGWHVSSLMTAVALLVANVGRAIVQTIERYGVGAYKFLDRGGEGLAQDAADMYKALFEFLRTILPDFGKLDYGDVVARGIDAPMSAMVAVPHGALWHALVYVIVMVALGYLFFRLREVAQ